jgi:hypothetical protein
MPAGIVRGLSCLETNKELVSIDVGMGPLIGRVFFIRFHADRLVIPLKPMDGKMTVPQQHALFPNDVLGTLNTQKRSIGRRSRAQWSRPRTCEER